MIKIIIAFLLLASPAFSADLALAESGLASWYGKQWHGKKTANGERYDMYSATCAHRKHPFNTWLRVVARNDRYTTCRVNNRGPYVAGRIVDLSYAGAVELGIEHQGTARVDIYIIPLSTIMHCTMSGLSLVQCK